MKHPTPNARGTSAAHCQAAGEGRLAVPYCGSCARFHWPPRAACPHCGGALTWRDASGTGKLVSWSVVHRAVHPELKDAAPYIVAFVELDEGPRLFTNVVGTPPEALRVGQRVRCRFEPALDPLIHVPVFEIVDGA
jgi:uncharacterized OB-fold protein